MHAMDTSHNKCINAHGVPCKQIWNLVDTFVVHGIKHKHTNKQHRNA